MSALNAPPADDDLDRLLTRFFRRALPHPWPTLNPPGSVQPALAPQRTGLDRGRLTLAASVAALVVGGWLLGGRLPLPAPGPGVSLNGGSAKLPKDWRPNADRPVRLNPR